MRRLILLLTCLVATASCELTEITIANPQDVIIAEVVLHAGETQQTALLHRTRSAGGSQLVPGAIVRVRDEASGAVMEFLPVTDSVCFLNVSATTVTGAGTCYAVTVPPTAIRPGATYTLRIETPDGDVMTGVTEVPGTFTVLQPAATDGNIDARRTCRIDPDTSFDIIWSRSAGASVYLTEARLRNIRAALRLRGVDIPAEEGNDPVELDGLSVSASDTTLNFPSELGLFDRFDEDRLPLLLALRNGLPPDVDATLVIAAADRNYVNWVRGGNFNPSGLVQISSVRGDGRGVFASTVLRSLFISTSAQARASCVP